jgi:hypothetical protein
MSNLALRAPARMNKNFSPVASTDVENVTNHEMPDGALYTG